MIDGFDALKNDAVANERQWLGAVKLHSYCVVTKVLGKNLVQVEDVIRTSANREIFAVPILGIHSAVLGVDIQPSVGDLVLVIFLNKFNRRMFASALKRFEDSGNKDWSIFDPEPQAYNRYSGVGLLLSAGLSAPDTRIEATRVGDVSMLSLSTIANIFALFSGAMDVVIDPPEEKDVNLTTTERANMNLDHYGKVTRRHGYKPDENGDLDAVDATVHEVFTENAPVTREYRADITETFGITTDPAGDPEGAPAEVAITVTRQYSDDTEVAVDGGKHSITVKEFTIEADEVIRLKVGDSVIEITSDGVTIEATQVEVN